MENDERSSTGSTVSGVFKTILQSPTPICMFYFSHPFGVSSPNDIKENCSATLALTEETDILYSNLNLPQMNSFIPNYERKTVTSKNVIRTTSNATVETISMPKLPRKENFNLPESHDPFRIPSTSKYKTTSNNIEKSPPSKVKLIPWPKTTWKREIILPPLIQFRGASKDNVETNLETILKTIRQAWNSPNSYEPLYNSSKKETSWKRLRKVDQSVIKMGFGKDVRPRGNRFLKRRYSVPEIIMRKYELATQRPYDNYSTETFPSPKLLPSTTGSSSILPPSSPPSTSSSRSRNNMYRISPASDSNLSRIDSLTTVEYQQQQRTSLPLKKSSLLRQIWEKDMQRRGNFSPLPLRHCRRVLSSDVECEECRKLILRKGDNFSDGSNSNSNNADYAGSSETLREQQTPSPIIGEKESSSVKIMKKLRKAYSTEAYSSSANAASSASFSNATKSSNVIEESNVQNADEDISSQEIISSEEFYIDSSEKISTSEQFEHFDSGGNKSPECVEIKDEENIENTKDSKNARETGEKEDNAGSSSGDSALDVFISDMLIENLRDLAKEARTQCFRRKINEDSEICSRTTKSGSASQYDKQYTEPEKSKQSENVSIKCDLSCQLNIDEIPSSDEVNIMAGTTYPDSNARNLCIVRNLKKIPRTESVEAQPSSASFIEDDDNSDESLSLVDSLDEPIAEENEEEIEEKESKARECIPTTSAPHDDVSDKSAHSPRREPQAFFIPIMDPVQENVSSVPTVSDTMPEKLKERIAQRQHELEIKKESSRRAHIEMEQNLITRQLSPNHENDKTSSTVQSSVQKSSSDEAQPQASKKTKTLTNNQAKILLRNDIDLLESYTVDSKGNLQFKSTEKIENKVRRKSSKTKPMKKQRIISHQSSKDSTSSQGKTIATKTTTTTTTTASSSSSYSTKKTDRRPYKSSTKEVKKMTIFQTQSDIITPDTDNGPRRIYQKTEIQDGEKRIEILEIVECLDSSSPDSSPNRYTRLKSSSDHAKKSASLKHSKIPIPVQQRFTCRSGGHPKSSRTRPESVGSCCNSKVDRAIAELLVNALKRPEQSVVEVIRSPKGILPHVSSMQQQQIQIRTISSSSSCSAHYHHHHNHRPQLISRSRSTPKRSANSEKYRQVFEVIPEEKSSVSMDSSNEESGTRLSDSGFENKASPQLNEESSIERKSSNSQDGIAKTNITTMIIRNVEDETSKTSSSMTNSTTNRGKDAVEKQEPKAWIGFLRQQTDSSSAEEEEQSSQLYPTSLTESSNQRTITSPSTLTGQMGTLTPKTNSMKSCAPLSSESDNILKLIEECSIPDKPNENKDNKVNIISSSQGKDSSFEQKKLLMKNKKRDLKVSSKATTSNEQSSNSKSKNRNNLPNPNINSMKVNKENHLKVNEEHIHNIISSETEPWRAQSPDICKDAIPRSIKKKSSTCTHSDETYSHGENISHIIYYPEKDCFQPCINMFEVNKCPAEESTEIDDSRSFTICSNQESPTTVTATTTMNSEREINVSSQTVESTSAVVTVAESSLPIDTNREENSSKEDKTISALNKCTFCCYCNPDLHNSSEAKSLNNIECVYCKRTRTPQKKEEETNTETDFFQFPTQNFFESSLLSIHDHTHTLSRDSDSVSTKCTKTNEKIRRYQMPESTYRSNDEESKMKNDEKDILKNRNNVANRKVNTEKTRKGLTRPTEKFNSNLANKILLQKEKEMYAKKKDISRNVRETKRHLKKLENPFDIGEQQYPVKSKVAQTIKNDNSNEKCFNSFSSSRSSSSSSASDLTDSLLESTSPIHKVSFPKFQCSKSPKKRSNKKDKKFTPATPETKTEQMINNDKTANMTTPSSSTTAVGNNKTGWTVTLAGSCSQGLAPDVEMRLSFPKDQQSSNTSSTLPVGDGLRMFHGNRNNNNENVNFDNSRMYRDYEFLENNNYTNSGRSQHPFLPSTLDKDSRRLLVPSGNPTSKINNSNNNTQREYNFPNLRHNSPNNQLVPHQPTSSKKLFRPLECNLALTSATTRTISNFSKGRRTMSYQSLTSTIPPLGGERSNRQNTPQHQQYGILSKRRLSLDSQGSGQQIDNTVSLSVMGNAIPPEQRPKVPTMSEKDLTRRHSRCFTRNTAFLT